MFSSIKIIKQAYQLVVAHKFLWAFGLLLVLPSIFNIVTYTVDGTSDKFFVDLNAVLAWLANNLSWATLIGLGVLVVIVGLTLLMLRAQAAIIVSVRRIIDKKETGFVNGFKNAKMFYWRIFGVLVLVFLFMLVALLVLGAPIYYLATSGLGNRAAILGIFALVIFIPVSVYFRFIISLAPNYVVLHDLKIKESIRASADLIKVHWVKILVFTVVLGIVTFFAVIITLSLAALVGYSVVQIVPLIYDLEGSGSNFTEIMGFTIGGLVILALQAGIAAFGQVAWVLFFQELVSPEKIEETPEVGVVPEVISS
ncbi:MAG: hypothetical protein Q8P83_03985 [bacterium]|nr:hypothetical protein [bacterium]